MGDFQLQYDAALAMATTHEDMSSDIDEHATTLVTSLNGGEGTEFILNALAAIGEAAGQLSQVNEISGTILRRTVHVTKGVDEAAQQDFRDLEAEIP